MLVDSQFPEIVSVQLNSHFPKFCIRRSLHYIRYGRMTSLAMPGAYRSALIIYLKN